MKQLILILLCLCDNPVFDKDGTDLGIPFERFTTKDSLGAHNHRLFVESARRILPARSCRLSFT